MKDNISIIFTAIIGTFLIVILPLYSILDRQDSMSYNVVLTETTNFVDNIRNNGFLDKESYYNYITALATTSNSYKVTIEAYRKTLIPDTDENGNIIEDSYVEEIELYNTKDILQVLEGEVDVDTDNSNQKNNVYLFDENDEIYVKVYNTNITSGSILYSALVGPVNNKVIDISYGGVVNDINWELYDKIKEETVIIPEVIMAVPVNKNDNTNIVQINSDGTIGDINCTDDDISFEELSICQELDTTGIGDGYEYLYDLSKIENKTIKIAIELKGFDTINIGKDTDKYVKLSSLYSGNQYNITIANNIISNYIRLNGMYADKELKLRAQGNYYYFDLILTNVTPSSIDATYSSASVTILPGLGQNEDKTSSLQAESVEIQLLSKDTVNQTRIAGPYNWKKVVKNRSLQGALITDGTVYVDQEIGFVVSLGSYIYHDVKDVVQSIENNLIVNNVSYTDLRVLYYTDFNNIYGIEMNNYIILLKYTESRVATDNNIEILNNWITTNESGVNPGEKGYYAKGGKSASYNVLVDNLGPKTPSFNITGTVGSNGWYTSDVILTLNTPIDRRYSVIESSNTISSQPIEGGVGVEKTLLTLTGANTRTESEFTGSLKLAQEGITIASAKAYDYLNNVSEAYTRQIKIDKTAPSQPVVTVKGNTVSSGWYTSDVRITMKPGTDSGSGVDRTTYKIEGANAIAETQISGTTVYTLTKEGKSKVTVTTYDKAGHRSQTVKTINIEKSEPKDATIEVIEGTKNSNTNEWYNSAVTVRIILNSDNSASGLANSTYKITGDTNTQEIAITDNIKEIKLRNDGIHTITVYTRTVAGNVKETTFTVKIDKTAPNNPAYTLMYSTAPTNGWFKVNPSINTRLGTDSVSGVDKTIIKIKSENGIEEINVTKQIKYTVTNEGINKITITTYDKAGNINEIVDTVRLEKSEPKDATIEVIEGTKNSNTNEWYNSNVKVRITLNDANSQSGLSGSTYKITGAQQVAETAITGSSKDVILNSNGVHTITVYTRTVAGNMKETTFTVKIDKTAPTKPKITINEVESGNLYGVKLYNKNITVSITAGKDSVSTVDKTTYKITSNSGQTVVVEETEGTQFEFSEEGDFTITAMTYDKAGNVNEVSQAISINKTRPTAPIITEINNKSVLDMTVSNIYGSDNPIEVKVKDAEVGNQLVLEFLNLATYAKKTVVVIAKREEVVFDVEFEQKGAYKFTVTQTNVYGTTSNESSGTHIYIYQ